MRFLLASIVLFAAGIANAKPVVSVVGDIAVMQQNADGTYDVICKNGNREKVTDLDIRLNNVCPNLTSSEPTNILSLQLRSDGNFDVVCKDFSRLIATPEDVIAGKACESVTPPPPPIVIEDGNYAVTSGNSNYCPQVLKANHENGVLVSIDLTFAGACYGSPNTFPCENNVCSKNLSGYQYTVKILKINEYDFTGSSGSAIFTKQ